MQCSQHEHLSAQSHWPAGAGQGTAALWQHWYLLSAAWLQLCWRECHCRCTSSCSGHCQGEIYQQQPPCLVVECVVRCCTGPLYGRLLHLCGMRFIGSTACCFASAHGGSKLLSTALQPPANLAAVPAAAAATAAARNKPHIHTRLTGLRPLVLQATATAVAKAAAQTQTTGMCEKSSWC